MKTVSINVLALLLLALVVALGAATGYYKMQAKQTHLEQRALRFSFRATRLEVLIEKLYNENIQLRVELERLLPPATAPNVPKPKTPEIISNSDKSC